MFCIKVLAITTKSFNEIGPLVQFLKRNESRPSVTKFIKLLNEMDASISVVFFVFGRIPLAF